MRSVDAETLRDLSLGETFGEPGSSRVCGDHLSNIHFRIYRRRAFYRDAIYRVALYRTLRL